MNDNPISGEGSPAPTASAVPAKSQSESGVFSTSGSDVFSVHDSHADPQGSYLAALALGALGVVFGDIGTSPLYSVRESFLSHHLPVSPENVLGVLSLIIWSLTSLICIKYLVFVVNADLHGEGGILALTALVSKTKVKERRIFPTLLVLGLFGTALLYGDGIITPAISVLSAVEGLEVATPFFHPYIVPITLITLVMLFAAQSHGTGKVGRVFGPIMMVWFAAIALMGVNQIVSRPDVLAAFNPWHAAQFVLAHGWLSFGVLGSVFLCVTGGEALYADMGHFGRKPIRMAWFFLVFPALLLNYLGQGALLLRDPAALENPFFRMAGGQHTLYFMVALATAATVIASQALISGAFSLTMQAVQLGYLPRLRVEQTSAEEKGQIYVPFVNWVLMLSCLALVIGFGSSSSLASAYGIAVTGTMVTTTILFYCLARHGWGWSLPKAMTICGTFLAIEGVFFTGNIIKILEGGWVPVLVGAGIFTLMNTWKQGRAVLYQVIQSRTRPLARLLEEIEKQPPTRVPGTAVFMYGNRTGTPPALLSNLRHNRVLHDRNLFVAVEISGRPYVPPPRRVKVSDNGQGFYRVCLTFGFMDNLDVQLALDRARDSEGKPLVPEDATFFLGKETLIPKGHEFAHMSFWREQLFALMMRNAQDATAFFNLPPDRVVELGTQVEI